MTAFTWLAGSEDQVPASDAWLTAAEASRLAAMRYTKRRSESRMARWVAKNAVARHLGLSLDLEVLRDVVIRNAADGAPEVERAGGPVRLAISMTDRAGWAVSIVADGPASVGCDLELVEPRSAAFVRDYFTVDEQSRVASAADDEAPLVANLIWSAKESALKVLRTGLRRDTRSVSVVYSAGGDAEWAPLVVSTEEGQRFPGWWARFGHFVLTVAASADLPAPTLLIEPNPLLTAAPAHSWMEQPLTT